MQAEENEFIVFDDAPWVTPETLPEESAETLELEQKGYVLRRFPFSSIRIVPSNNPRSRTERAGIVRLARNIARRGLQQPVTVRPDPENESSVELVFGYRRMAAMGYTIAQGWLPEDYDVVCIVRKLNDSQTRLAALTENEEREAVDARPGGGLGAAAVDPDRIGHRGRGGLVSEDDLGFVTKLEETELDEDAAD